MIMQQKILSKPNALTSKVFLLNRRTQPRRNQVSQVRCQEQTKGPKKAVLITDQTWKNEVEDCATPVLIDFWAPWCGPCRMISPIMDELVDEYQGKIKVSHVNTDQSPQIASKLGIRSIPTVMVFVEGEKKESVIGAVPKKNLVDLIDKYVD